MKKCLVVGAGIFGATFAHEMALKGYSVDIIDKRNFVGGNAYTEEKNNILVHKYGPHIFHTKYSKIWDYVNQFAEFNNFVNSPIANYNGELYNLPFNMNTFTKIWDDVKTPQQAKDRILEDSYDIEQPENLEEQAIKLVGKTIYKKLIKEYTEKQWGQSCDSLPSFIIRRLPLRFSYDNNYFTDKYQGIPTEGYTKMVENMLDNRNIAVNCEVDFSEIKDKINNYDIVLYTGQIDKYFDYKFGALQYRSLKFETEIFEDIDNYQGNAVINYTSNKQPYTRKIEHKFFNPERKNTKGTIVTTEYPDSWNKNKEPFYPINNKENDALYKKYLDLSKNSNIIFGGRLGQYRYYNMDQATMIARNLANNF